MVSDDVMVSDGEGDVLKINEKYVVWFEYNE